MSALVVGLCPAFAFACDEDATAQAEAAVRCQTKVEAVAKCEAKADVKTTVFVVKNKTVCKVKVVTAVADDTECPSKAMNTQGIRRAWEPGHLIEPDSMKLGPGDDLKTPDAEQWVTISSRDGVIHIHRHPWNAKKTEGRTLQQYGPYRS